MIAFPPAQLYKSAKTTQIALMHTTTKPLILFDLVSTITDAGPRYAEAYVQMTGNYGLNIPDRHDILKDLGNKNLKQIIADHSPDLPPGLAEGFMADCNRACDAMLYDVHWVERVFPGVRNALETLVRTGYTLGLYTGTREDAMQAQLRYHNIEAFFDPALVRGKDNQRDGMKTPQALKIEQIGTSINLFRARPGKENEKVVVIGDTLSDFEAARAHGAAFIGFAESPEKGQVLSGVGITAIFTSYDALPDLIDTALIKSELRPGNLPAHHVSAARVPPANP